MTKPVNIGMLYPILQQNVIIQSIIHVTATVEKQPPILWKSVLLISNVQQVQLNDVL